MSPKDLMASSSFDSPAFLERALPYGAISPFSTVRIGRIFKRPPSNDCALPIRPPFARYSKVSKSTTNRLLSAVDSAAEITSSTDPPWFAVWAAAIVENPSDIDTCSLSMTWILISLSRFFDA